ncbi:MAG: hypothetical protein Q8P39_00915 [Candidatus Yanofskybacteria bacterium]|nr:hypothetical protein [Candidatus Yanofskybacteria bacterium]
MDIQELKEFIEHEGGKVVIVENGKPVLVALSFEEYKGQKAVVPKTAALPSVPEERGRPASPEPVRAREELTIEDLPL